MIAPVVLVTLSAVGLVLAVSGALLLIRRLWVSGSGLLGCGVTVVVGSLLDATGRPDAATLVLTAAGALLLPVALSTYPRPDWQHPIDFVALATIIGAGALATVRSSNDGVVGVMGMVIGLVLIAHTWWRIERATGPQRWTLTWMALGAAVPALVTGLIVFVAATTTGAVVAFGLFSVLGPAMYVGVARPQVVDVRALVVNCAVFAVSATVFVAGFMLVASFVEILAGATPAVGTLAVIGMLAATTFHPVQVILRGVVDELLFGQRPDPLGAASHVAGHIGDDPRAALLAVRQALVLPYAAVRSGDVLLAESGVAVTHTRTLPLRLGDNEFGRHGELVVGLRPGDLTLSEADQKVLALLAPLLAQTLRVAIMAADLQSAREETVSALQEERRRLRRDLHDGLGPRLSGIAFTSDAARNTLRSDPDGAQALLAELRAETGRAIEEIRRLIYAMRPPALDELGLVAALRSQAVGLRTANGEPLRVSVAAAPLPEPLPAAVEVAAYRIVTEALTNVARHSGSDTAAVWIGHDQDALVIEIDDQGAGEGPWRPGVGLASMRERATELGGTLSADGGRPGGRVVAVLPIIGLRR